MYQNSLLVRKTKIEVRKLTLHLHLLLAMSLVLYSIMPEGGGTGLATASPGP